MKKVKALFTDLAFNKKVTIYCLALIPAFFVWISIVSLKIGKWAPPSMSVQFLKTIGLIILVSFGAYAVGVVIQGLRTWWARHEKEKEADMDDRHGWLEFIKNSAEKGKEYINEDNIKHVSERLIGVPLSPRRKRKDDKK